MSVLLSKGTGNFTAATAVWGLVDSTSYLNAENATESLLTTAYSGTRSSAFTPGAITVYALVIKLCERIGTTGTISVSLRNSTIGLDDFVTGTEVTINVSDLPSCLEADLNGGWICLVLATPILLLAATDYNIQAKTSSTTQVDLWCDGTADNISRCLVTTTEQAPAAGDDFIVCRQRTAPATATAVVITLNETAATDYGSTPTAANSLIGPGFAVCDGGTVRVGTAAATTYQLKLSNSVVVYSGGVWEEATTGTPMPRDSSFDFTFDCGANADYGFTPRNLCTFTRQGQSRTAAKLIDRCKLNTDEAAAQTILGVDTDTGWKSGDEIVIVSTSRTGSETEKRVLASDATATTLTVTVGLTNAHSGTSPTQAEVVLLTRNVRMHGASATLQAYVDIKPTAVVDWDWAQTYWMGSATANKRGVDIGTTTGALQFDFCSIHDFVVASSISLNLLANFNNISLDDLILYNITSYWLQTSTTSGTTWNLNNLLATGCAAGSQMFLQEVGGTIGNITAAGNASTGSAISISIGSELMGAVGILTAHSNAGPGIAVSGTINGTISNIISWRNSGVGLSLSSVAGAKVNAYSIFGNLTTNLQFSAVGVTTEINNGVVAGDTTVATTQGILGTGQRGSAIRINSSTFGVTSGIFVAHTRDVTPVISDFTDLIFNNCILASATEILTPTTLMAPGVVFSSQKHDQTSGNNRQQRREGLITLDTTAGMFDVTPSIRLAPSSATEDLELIIGRVNVNSGQAATVSVKVRESVAGDGTDYNGERVDLAVRRNDSIGIVDDVDLDTATVASEGAFETLTGTTAAATEDGVMEFIIDCNGTTGWVNVDTLTVTVA
jgi:hypothetical protein